ncbi:MAG TPA: endonuclease/exonuclease/phosphatase family protein [Lacisediminihabitans sp.]|uniref:endonuclease/exonuclease/phosphatase family protein n=1 Tax=Lacisediminihabitans sp. TaxID=2787631 RepID=UPI002ED9079F
MFRRLLAAVLILVVAAALLVLAWPQLFGLQQTVGPAQLVSLRGSAIAAAVILMIALGLLALLSRAFRRLGSSLALLLLAFALVSTAVLATRGFGDTAFQTKADSDITVMSWNTLGDAPGAQAIAELALSSDADIVTLPETSNQTAVAVAGLMKDGGRPMWVHTIAFDHISKARSTSVLTSTDLGAYSVDEKAGSTSTLPSVVLAPDDGSGPVIVAVHAVAPTPKELVNWRADLRTIAGFCAGRDVIMAGDFNSTLDHFAGLGDGRSSTLGNCADAALQTKNAAVGTWPSSLPALLGAPIDHVMTTPDWRVTGMRVVQNLDGDGSDHRPIVVQLQPKG